MRTEKHFYTFYCNIDSFSKQMPRQMSNHDWYHGISFADEKFQLQPHTYLMHKYIFTLTVTHSHTDLLHTQYIYRLKVEQNCYILYINIYFLSWIIYALANSIVS